MFGAAFDARPIRFAQAGNRCRRLALLLLLLAAPAGAQDQRAPFDIDPLMECRARAIAQLELADFEQARFGRAETEAIREMTSFALRLGFWRALPRSVGEAAQDMDLGEQVLIENARRVRRIAEDFPGPEGLTDALRECVPVAWSAARAVIDAMFAEGLPRR